MKSLDTLATLLRHAESERDAAMAGLRRVEAQVGHARGQQAQLIAYRGETEQRHAEQFREAGSIEVLRTHQGFMDRLSQAIEQQTHVVSGGDGRLAQLRQELQARELQVASVRKLIERRQQDLGRQLAQREQRQTDEQAARTALAGSSPLGPAARQQGSEAGAAERAERRAAIGQRPLALVPSKSAQADLEPRHSAPSRPAASRGTRLALRPSMLAQASMEPRSSLPSGAEPGHEQSGGLFMPGEGLGLMAQRGLPGRPTYPSDEGQT